MRLLIWLCILPLLAACTQTPAGVVYKGNEFYGRERGDYAFLPRDHQTYAANSARYKDDHLEQGASAQLSSVAARDLAPPPLAHAAKPPVSPSIAARDMPPAVTSATKVALPPNMPFQFVDKKEVQARKAEMQPSLSSAGIEREEGEQTPSLAPLPVASFESAHRAVAAPVASLSEPSLPAVRGDASPGAAPHFVWPVEGKVVSTFGPKKQGLNNDGINISTDENEPIWAADKGEVVYAGNALKGYGNTVLIRHDKKWLTTYAHASKLLVKKGDKVRRGQLIGYVGASGDVDGPQLHFSLRRDKAPVNPENYLPKILGTSSNS